MDTSTHDFKYKKHSEKQYELILEISEKLFIKKGIDKVTLSDISAECGIMRSTFYRYFKNKEEILWYIMLKNAQTFSHKLQAKVQAANGTTYDKFQIFIELLYDTFLTNTDFYLFLNLFNDTYQYVTSGNDSPSYNNLYNLTDFHSGDMVQFLSENFHDGSVNPELDPKSTAVTIIYSALSMATGMSKQIKTLPLKYDISSEDVVHTSLLALLSILK